MTTSVKFRKMGKLTLFNILYFNKIFFADTKIAKNVTRIRAKALLNVWFYDFYDRTLSTE